MRRLAQDAALHIRTEIQQRQRVRRARRGDAGNGGELPPPLLDAHQRAVGAHRDAARRRRRAVGRPAVHRIEVGAEEHRRGHDVGEILPVPARRRLRLRIGEVLRTRPAIDAHRVGLRQVVALRVGMHQRAAPHPVFRRGLRVEHQRIGVRPLQDRVLLAGQVVGGPRIGEREAVGDVEMVLVLLAARDDRAGEAVVQPLASGARDMRQHAVEHASSSGIGVEAAIDEVAQAAPGLRAAPGIGLLDAAQRIGVGARRISGS